MSLHAAYGSGGRAASTPEFKAASDRSFAWVNKNCSADQASQIVGMGAGK